MKKCPIFLVFALVVSVAGAAIQNSKESVRVGTYNIRLSLGDKETPNAWDSRKADLVALVKNLNLDVFGLQEVCPDQVKYLSKNLPEFAYVGEHREADRKSGEASPVCYRKSRFSEIKSGTFWLSETPDVPGMKGWGAACPRVCSWVILKDLKTNRSFCFANVHTDHISELAREKGMLLVVNRMNEFGKGLPIVFTGDHNCRENEKPAQSVSKILKNALYETLTSPEGSWRTFNGWWYVDKDVAIKDALKLSLEERNGHKWRDDFGARIDYIYVSPSIKVLDYKTHNDLRPGTKLYPSDHFPITATIQFCD